MSVLCLQLTGSEIPISPDLTAPYQATAAVPALGKIRLLFSCGSFVPSLTTCDSGPPTGATPSCGDLDGLILTRIPVGFSEGVLCFVPILPTHKFYRSALGIDACVPRSTPYKAGRSGDKIVP